VFYWKIWT